MATVTTLSGQVDEVVSLAYALQHKIADNPDGILTGLIERIEEIVGGIVDKIKEALDGKLAPIRDRISDIVDSISDLVDKIAQMGRDIANEISGKLGEAYDNLRASFEGIVGSMLSAFQVWVNTISAKYDQVVEAFRSTVGDLITALREKFASLVETLKTRIAEVVRATQDLASTLAAKIRESWEKITAAISAAYETASTKIREVLNDLLAKIRDAVDQLRSKIEELYERASEYLQENVMTPLQEARGEVQETVTFKANVLRRVAMGEYESWDAFVSDISDPLPAVGAIAGFVGMIAIGILIAPALSTVFQPVLENLGHLAREKFTPTLVDPMTTITAEFRGLVPTEWAHKELALQGYEGYRQWVMREASRPLPSPGTIQDAFLRGFISEAEHDAMLSRHGYTAEDIDLFKALYRLIPGPADLIRMAVREAFTPEIAEKFGQYEDFPEAFAEWAERQGLTREWAERYWAAHWELPSATMGFEMLHRRIIDEDELKMLLRALDVMPWWRDKLIQMSYVPFTRVDVRRMYKLGILDEEGVYWSYRDIGYNDEKARALTEFTIRYYSAQDKTELDEYRDLTRAVFTSAFKRGLIGKGELIDRLEAIGYRREDADFLATLAETEVMLKDTKEDRIPLRTRTTNLALDGYKRGIYDRDELAQILSGLGYTETEVGWYIALSDYEVGYSLKAIALETAHENYINRTWDQLKTMEWLGRLNLRSTEIDALFAQWDLEREARTRKPTEAQFRAAMYAGLISVEDYAEELRGLGYPEKYVKMLVELAIARRKG